MRMMSEWASNPEGRLTMLNHITLMALFAVAVAAVFACLGKDGFRERLVFGLWLFLGLMGGGLALSWLMFPFPR